MGARNKSESERLHSAWKCVRAKWELAIYAPDNCGDDLPEQIGLMHCEADQAALLAYLLAPASTVADLARKLRVVRDESAASFDESKAIIAQLAEDARVISHPPMQSLA